MASRRSRHSRHSRYFVTGRPSADDRPALPAGHPVSWGAITSGTVLDGVAYPLPPMTRAAPTPRAEAA